MPVKAFLIRHSNASRFAASNTLRATVYNASENGLQYVYVYINICIIQIRIPLFVKQLQIWDLKKKSANPNIVRGTFVTIIVLCVCLYKQRHT